MSGEASSHPENFASIDPVFAEMAAESKHPIKTIDDNLRTITVKMSLIEVLDRYWDSYKESEEIDSEKAPEASKGVQSELSESLNKTFKNVPELETYITTLAQKQQELRIRVMQADETASEELKKLEEIERALLRILKMWQEYPKGHAFSRGEKM